MIAGQLALVTAAMFTGAAIYVSVAEQPARLALDDRAMLVEWKHSYERAAIMQASLALISAVFGATAFWQSGDWRWLAGALLVLANGPHHLVIRLTNNVLRSERAGCVRSTRTLIEWWSAARRSRRARLYVAYFGR